MNSSVPHSTGEIDDRAPVLLSVPPGVLMRMREVVCFSSAATSFGFNVAGKCTRLGFTVARSCISAPASVLDGVLGHSDSSISQIIRSVSTTVGAAEAVSLASILLAHSATSMSLAVAERTLEYSGASSSEEGGLVWRGLLATVPSRLLHYTPVLQAISDMILTFLSPIQDLSTQELRESLVAFALLQQSGRPPLHVCAPSPTDHDEAGRRAAPVQAHDLLRCMGFSAAAYGSLAMNFLEFIPSGIYRADIYPLLVPGVTQEDVLCRNEDVGLFSTGFVLVSDHTRRTIVLAVRGSMHVNDIITDLTCAPTNCSNIFSSTSKENLNSMASSSDGFNEIPHVHEGFLLAANELDALLQEEVHQALHSHGGTSSVVGAEPYHLLLCGHSLGAGVASVLAVKWENIFPGLRCVALAPPCSFSLQAARSSRHLITSVIICDDMVSRLSLGSAYDLRDSCLHLFREDISVSQMEGGVDCNEDSSLRLSQYILRLASRDDSNRHEKSYEGEQGIKESDNIKNDDHMRECLDDTVPAVDFYEYSQFVGSSGTPSHEQTEELESDLENKRKATAESNQRALQEMHHVLATLRGCCMTTTTKLYPAGTLIHIVDREQWQSSLSSCVIAPSLPITERNPLCHPFPTWSSQCRGKEYVCSADGRSVYAISDTGTSVAYISDQLTFTELQLSGGMFSDHMPQRYMHMLKQLFPMSI